jgi:hypothetical protein
MVKSNTGRFILLSKNHMVDGPVSEQLNLGEIISQLYDLMTMIENFRMDNNEFVALKVLILLSPGFHLEKIIH